jgi:hypothetical protein
MTISSSAKSRVAYVPEVTFGAIPATPTFLVLRRTGGNLQTKKTTMESDEINLDARPRAVYQTGQDVSGQYDFELSYGSFDDMLAAVLMSTWSTNVISDGITQSSFTFEETVDTGTGTFAYNRFAGCEVNSMALTLASRAGVKGSLGIMGQMETTDTAIVSGATYTAPNSNQIETAVTVASLAIDSLSPTPKIKNLSLNINRGMRIRDKVGSLYSEEFGINNTEVSGSFDAYFESKALYDAVLAHGKGAISFNLGSVTNKKYTFAMANCQFLDGTRKLGGRGEDVMITVPFKAVGDATTPLLTVTRNVA